MQQNYENILNKPLHTFTVDELGEVKAMADQIFEPLVRPFRQKRVTQDFSFRETIRTAMRIGQLMPAYQRTEREHRKSRLLIFMSLSGIDRCAAVSLIPLFSSLHATALSFRLFIYTDDVIQAEFTSDGFLANDWRIAWNHVAGPVVFNRMLEMPIDEKEDILLMIDSLGGNKSKWFYNWTYEDAEEVQKEQQKYMAQAGRYSWANRIRQELNGDFKRFDRIKLPEQWNQMVERNCKERFLEAPALREYMIRNLFHPEYGTVKHGQAHNPYVDAFELIKKLKGKFKSMHLLTPNLSQHNTVYERIKHLNVFDYHHKANTPRGFAEVLASIVHGSAVFDGPYTKKISYEEIRLGEYNEEEPDDMVEDGEGDGKPIGEEGEHTEMREGNENCFEKCPAVEKWLPGKKMVSLAEARRGKDTPQYDEIAYSQLDVDCFFPRHFDQMNYDYWWKERVLPLFQIENSDSEYTRVTKAQRLLDHIKQHHVVCIGSGLGGLVVRHRPEATEKPQEILERIEFEAHHTRVLKVDIKDLLEMLAPCYHKYMEELPLKHVVWCTTGAFKHKRMAISVEPSKSRLGKRQTAWHEALHWLEHICPPVGAFTNHIIRRKCGGVVLKAKLIEVHKGEFAMPVTDGTTEWIIDYAGKWYERYDDDLPNNTEVLTVYGEYFAAPEKLALLMKHDPFMTRFIAFVIMGGPVAAMEALEHLKKENALHEIHQRNRKSKGYRATRVSGGRGSGGSRGGGRGGFSNKKSSQGFGF